MAPPAEYGWEASSESNLSSSTAFQTDNRDMFLGKSRCIICGKQDTEMLGCGRTTNMVRAQRVQLDPATGESPPTARGTQWYSLVSQAYLFFIRFSPNTRKFILVNYSERQELQQHHGKAVALDINDRHAPFPSLFTVHEMRVRGFHPFKPTSPPMLVGNAQWQDWISSDRVFDDTSNSFFRHGRPPADDGGSGRGHFCCSYKILLTKRPLGATRFPFHFSNLD